MIKKILMIFILGASSTLQAGVNTTKEGMFLGTVSQIDVPGKKIVIDGVAYKLSIQANTKNADFSESPPKKPIKFLTAREIKPKETYVFSRSYKTTNGKQSGEGVIMEALSKDTAYYFLPPEESFRKIQ